MVEVVRSHRHLLLSNMNGMGGTPPLNESLHQSGAHKSFQKEVNDGLKARLPNVGLGIEGE